MEHGVEVGQDGEVAGLITTYPLCGNDPYLWYTKRINLSDLAGFMDPDGIDDSIVHPDEIEFLKENESRSLDRHGLPFSLMSKAGKMRSPCTRRVEAGVNEQPYVIRSFSREQIDQ
jgi:hypothetical protein